MKILKTFLIIFFIIAIFSAICLLSVLKSNKKAELSPSLPQKEEPIKEQFPTVIIDAGHGGEDGGAIGKNGAYEKDINLAIAKKLKERLDNRGIPCVLTRETDILLYDKNVDYEGKKKKLDLLARKEFAEKYDNAIFISIHQNSFSKSQYSGFQVYYSPNNPSSKILAQNLQSIVRNQLQPNNDRTIKSSSSIYLLDELFCPAVLIECGFISNESECEKLCDEEYQNKLCEAIIQGIHTFINTKNNGEMPS